MTKQARAVLAICAVGIVIAGGLLVWQRHAAPVANAPAPAASSAMAPAPLPPVPAPLPPAPAPVPPATTPEPAAPPQPAGVPLADCIRPDNPPSPPDGASSTQALMTQGHDTIQAFVDRLEAFQACLNNKADRAGPDVNDQQKQQWIDQGNDAVDQATALAAAFSAQLKVFHSTHPQP